MELIDYMLTLLWGDSSSWHYLTVSGHVTFHAAAGRELHVTQGANVLLHASVSSNVSLQHTARHKRLQTLDTHVRFLACHTYQPSTFYTDGYLQPSTNQELMVISQDISLQLVLVSCSKRKLS